MSQHGVTIAIPNWNHEFFLARSIRAALAAADDVRGHGLSAEVLVVDDASRDGSRSLLRQLEARYREQGLRVQLHESNLGLAASRNTALTEARFRSIVFCDADNEIVPTNLYLFNQALQETSAAAVYGNLLIRKTAARTAYRLVSNESPQNRVFRNNYIDAFALFDRDQLLDVGGYSPTLPAWEDWELWLHLTASGRKIVFVPLAFGYYYELPHSMLRTPRDGEQMLSRCYRIFDQLGFREHCQPRTHHLRYLPGVGYL